MMSWMRRSDGSYITTTYILDQLVVYQVVDHHGGRYSVSRKVVAAANPVFVELGTGANLDEARELAQKDWEGGIL